MDDCLNCDREDCGKRETKEVDIAAQFVKDYHADVITTAQLDAILAELDYKHTIIERRK